MPELRNIPLGSIDEPPTPVRAGMDEAKLNELAESIGQIGVQQPIVVLQEGERFRIVCGHRRYLASRQAGRFDIPAMVHQEGAIDEFAVMLAENIAREDISPAEEALWFAELCDKHNFTEEQLCKAVRKGPDYIADRLKLLRGDRMIFDALLERKIGFGVARELNKVHPSSWLFAQGIRRAPTEAELEAAEPFRRMFLDSAIRSGANYRTVQTWVTDWKLQQVGGPAAAVVPVEAAADAAAPVAPAMCCEMCGQTQWPYLLRSIFVCTHELAAFRQFKNQLAQEV